MPAAATLTPGELVAQHPSPPTRSRRSSCNAPEACTAPALVLSLGSTFLGYRGPRRAHRRSLRTQAAARSGVHLRQTPSAGRHLRSRPAVHLSVFQLPLELYGHHIALRLRTQRAGLASWLADWAKSELLTAVFATLTLWGLYTSSAARRAAGGSTRGSSPCPSWPAWSLFRPSSSTRSSTASSPSPTPIPNSPPSSRSLAHTAGLDIPESRIFLMHASDKVTTYNAYVTGFGATKRIVVWDTTARDLTLPQTLFVFGHEMGHYVLHHIYLGLAFTCPAAFAGFWLLQRLAIALALCPLGERWQIRALGDWSSLPLLCLIASLLSFFGEPLASAFSRWEEHQADVYGLAITQPVTTQDAGQVAAQAFQMLGEKSYSYPNPSPLLVFWSYSHPPIAERIRFALSRHPTDSGSATSPGVGSRSSTQS